MHTFQCWIVGEGSLALQCAEILLQRGHSLRGLVSPDRGHAAWAAERGLRWSTMPADLTALLAAEPFDLLFSVANTAVLPAPVLALPRLAAINYHDAPLPKYAGMYATSWALIHQETHHAVSWHEMLAKIDGGKILARQSIEVAPDETALTLNAKCYAAAIDTFNCLLLDLESDTLRPREQDLARRSYFGLHRRPRAAAVLDWSRPARELSALVRALDFGPYLNNLGRPKLRLEGRILTVTSADLSEEASTRSSAGPALSHLSEGTSEPGTVLAVTRDALQVATIDGALTLRGLATLDGVAVAATSLGLRVGDRLPIWPADTCDRLTKLTEQIARGEKFFASRLRDVQPVPAPYAVAAASSRLECRPLVLPPALARCDHDTLAVAFALHLARFHGLAELDLGFSGPDVPPPEFAALFAPLVPWRVAPPADASFTDILQTTRAALADLRKHNTHARDLATRVPALAGRPAREYPVAVIVRDTPDAITLPPGTVLALALIAGEAVWIHDAARVSAGHVDRIAAQLLTLLADLLAAPDQPFTRAAIVPPAELAQLAAWNDTFKNYPQTRWTHELLADQAARTPDAPAVTFADRTWTYAAFNARVNQLAHHLRTLGIGPEQMVGVCMQRSDRMMIALWAILKSGGAYVPLDPTLPADRLAFMQDDAELAVVIGERATLGWLPPSVTAVVLDDLDLTTSPVTEPAVPLRGDNLIYAIFTSGSTGRPKAAMNSHAGVLNRLQWGQDAFPLTPADRVLQKTPISFDVSVYEVFWPLMVGAHLVVARPDGHKDSAYLASIIESARITSIHFVPSMLQIFLTAPDLSGCASVRQVFCSGEALPYELQQQFFSRIDATLHNLYGPTEASVEATAWTCVRDDARRFVPIGRPIANVQIHVLDPHLRPVPIGACGELCIGGVGVARGYCNREALTAERFVADPTRPHDPAARLYRTGDRARHLPDGSIEYLGRLDFQVKIRGVRIEPGEIEAALRTLPVVREAVVIAREDTPGDRRLVAYLTASPGGNGPANQPTVGELRTHLLATLPEAMVPAVFVWLPALPLLTSGKVDRAQLPAPGSERRNLDAAYVAPTTPVQHTLAAIWATLLGLERVGVHDNFFELGGDSILGLQVLSRARQAGWRLTPKQLFQAQTIARLADLADPTADTTALTETLDGPVPLTPIQRWFFAQPLRTPNHWNQDIHLDATTPIDPADLAAALVALTDHHDALRLRFTPQPVPADSIDSPVPTDIRTRPVPTDSWQQTHAAPGQPAPLQLLTAPAGVDLETWIAPAVAAAHASLDITRGPLWRVLLVTRQGAPARIVVIVHHLAVDGLSWRILVEDLELALTQRAAGRPIALPTKTSSFKTWSDRLHAHAAGDTLRAEHDHWTAALACPPALPATTLPDREGDARDVLIALDPDATRTLLHDVPAAYRTRINDILLTALAHALRDWTGRGRTRIDLEAHGREDIVDGLDIARTVGWFTSISPVVLDLDPNGDAPALCKIKESLRSIPHKGIGYGLIRHIRRDPLPDHAPSGISFNYLGQFDQPASATLRIVEHAARPTVRRAPADQRPHTLEIEGRILDEALLIKWRHNPAILPTASVQSLADSFLVHLRRLITHCAARKTTRAFTPSDVPGVRLTQDDLDAVLRVHPDAQDIRPLAPAQRDMFAQIQRAPDSGAYVLQWTARFDGHLDESRLHDAFDHIIKRHPIFRTAFLAADTHDPVQIVRSAATLEWSAEDWRALSPELQTSRLHARLHRERADGLDARGVPRLRVHCLRLADDRHRIVWTHHHLVADGWSFVALLREVAAAYDDPNTAAAVVPYTAYLDWLTTRDTAAAEIHWRRLLDGAAHPRPLTRTRALEPGEHFGDVTVRLSESTSNALLQLAQTSRVTASTLVQGAWALLLAARRGARDIVFGVTHAGRPTDLSGAATIQGPTIATLPLRALLDDDTPLDLWLAHLQAQQADAAQYTHVSESQIAQWCAGGRPVFDTSVRFQNFPKDPALRRWTPDLELSDPQWIDRWHHTISLAVVPEPAWRLHATHARAHLDADTMTDMLRDLEALLEAFTQAPKARLGALLARILPSRVA